MTIHNRGYWLTEDKTEHKFDSKLSNNISKLLIGYSVIDLGCGPGDYVRLLRSNNIDIIGCDGNPNTKLLSNGLCFTTDLSEDVNLPRRDIVLSLEVGEHIPAEYEHIFLNNICKTAKYGVILSWAVEGQNGYGHFNCKNNDYIIDKMTNKGFIFNQEVSTFLRSDTIYEWFRNTVMVFEREANATFQIRQ